MASLTDLRKRAKSARTAADKADADARELKSKARDLAATAVDLEAQLDTAEWVKAQVDLGVDEDDIDAQTRTIRNLQPGPTYDEGRG